MAASSSSRSDRAIRAYAEWMLRWRWAVLCGTLLVAGLASSGLHRLEFSTDYKRFFGPNNPELQAFEAFQNTYTKNDNVLFVVKPSEGEVFTTRVLSAIERLTEAAWQLPYSSRVDSVTNFQHTFAVGDELIVQDLVESALALKPEDLERVRRIALAEPLLVHRIVAADAGATAVNVTLQFPGDGAREVPEVIREARRIAAELRVDYPELTIALTGLAALSNAMVEAAQRDLVSILPLMYLVLVVTMVLFLRSASGALITLLIASLSALTGVGMAGWLGIPLTPPSAMAATVILTVAIADSVHLLVTTIKEMGAGATRREALIESLRVNMQPVFLTTLTTVIGFLSLNFSDAIPFRDLGNITAMGVFAAWVYTLLLLPPLVDLLPMRPRPVRAGTPFSMDRLGDFIVRRRNECLAVMLTAVVVLALFIPRLELNDMFVEYFGPSIAFRRDTDFASQHLSGIYQLHFSLGAGEDDGISRPDYLGTVDRFAAWLREQPAVVHVNTLTDTMKRLNRNMHADDESWYRLPEQRELAAQYLLLYEISLPYGLDLNDQIDVAKSATRLSVTLQNISAREIRALESDASSWLRENAPESMWTRGTSTAVMFSKISERNIRAMLRGTLVAFGLIALVMIAALRSVKLGLISLIPNLVPTVLALGFWGMTVREVGMAVAVVTAVSLGIIVDATVHFLSKYQRAQRERGASAIEAVRYAISTVGAALWITFLILIAGFAVLSFSAFKPNAGLGLLTAISIACALAADFFLLPPVLILLEGRKEVRSHELAHERAA